MIRYVAALAAAIACALVWIVYAEQREVAAQPLPKDDRLHLPEDRPGRSPGHVAVLTTQKTPLGALRVLADLHQKYPDVLGDRIFDVQAVDLSSRGLGVLYRGVAGPPGSESHLMGVCAQLTAAGHAGCSVEEY